MKVINFYQFLPMTNLEGWQATLRQKAAEQQLLGTILLASEGINGSLSGEDAAIDTFMDWLRTFQEFKDLTGKASWGDTPPFKRLWIKIKKQILDFPEDHDPSVADIHNTRDMDAAAWQALVAAQRDDVVVLDTRNDYELAYGKFRGADDLGLTTFDQFPTKFLEKYQGAEEKTFLMYCTGGIRCEKAAAFAQKAGFKNVFKLSGGILDYFHKTGGKEWEGTCFVFDNRWAVTPQCHEADGAQAPAK